MTSNWCMNIFKYYFLVIFFLIFYVKFNLAFLEQASYSTEETLQMNLHVVVSFADECFSSSSSVAEYHTCVEKSSQIHVSVTKYPFVSTEIVSGKLSLVREDSSAAESRGYFTYNASLRVVSVLPSSHNETSDTEHSRVISQLDIEQSEKIKVDGRVFSSRDVHYLSGTKSSTKELESDYKSVNKVVKSQDVESVVVDDVIDSYAQANLCGPDGIAGRCNLRSAVKYCVFTSASSRCEMHLPEDGAIEMNPQLGGSHMYVSMRYSGEYLVIVGHGSTVSLAGDDAARLMDVDAVIPFHLELRDLTFQGFNGVFYLQGLKSFKCSSVNFQQNSADGGTPSAYFSNIEFGGALYLYDVESVILEDSNFYNNSANKGGGAVYFKADIESVRISGCQFTYNTAGITMSTASSVGGALYFHESILDIEIKDSVFEWNSAYSGGGAILLDYLIFNLVIIDCNISNNKAVVGGGLYLNTYIYHSNLTRTLFKMNEAKLSGGAIYAGSFLLLTVTDCNLSDNKAGNQGGGLYMLRDVNYATVSKTLFSSNKADEGGAIFLTYDVSDLTISYCIISDNMAERGGGLYIFTTSPRMSLIGNLFENNTASESGGAVYSHTENKYMVVQDSIFKWNSAVSGNGGALCFGAKQSFVEYRNSSFIENTAGDKDGNSCKGGAIFYDNNNNNIFFSDCLFDGNVAAYGGGVAAETENINWTIARCSFVNNEGTEGGGGLFFDELNSNLLISQSLFENNSAARGGGVLLQNNNIGFFFEDTLFDSNSASFGGGVYLSASNDDGTLVGLIFYRNDAAAEGGGIFQLSSNNRMKLTNISFIENTAEQGGGIFTQERNWWLTVENSIFRRNHASLFGAGFFASSFIEGLAIRNVQFVGNVAVTSGGAIYFLLGNDGSSEGRPNVIEESLFSNNLCTEAGGGAISLAFSNVLEINNCIFTNNSAYEGGSIYTLMKNKLVCTNLHVESNVAHYGGGLSIGIRESVLMSNSTITLNVAHVDGGGIIVSKKSVLSINNTFLTKNRAEELGGAIHYDSDKLDIRYSHVTDNMARQGGGGIYALGSNINIADSSLIWNWVSDVSGNGGAMLFVASNHVSLVRNIVADNFVFNEGTLMFESCENVVIEKNKISSNEATIGGGVVMKQSTNFHFEENVFNSNIASDMGGAVYGDGCGRILVSGDEFRNNTAGGVNGGAAVWVADSELIFESTTLFSKNKAPNGGGTVFWDYGSNMSEPAGMSPSMFVDNEALYGSMWATESIHMQVDSSSSRGSPVKSTTSDKFEVTTYQEPYEMTVSARDFYQQRVLSDSLTLVKLELSSTGEYFCGGRQPSITGVSLQEMREGDSLFKGTFVSCVPGGNMTLVFKDSESGNSLRSNEIVLEFRKCVVGEYYRDGECRICEKGFYSKTPNEDLSVTECLKCPANAESCEGSDIVLSPGFWSINDESDSIMTCPMGVAACSGGIAAKTTETSVEAATDSTFRVRALVDSGNFARATRETSNITEDVISVGCNAGYLGPLCAICEDGYYYDSTLNACSVCEPAGMTAIVVAILTLLFIYPLILVIKKILDRLGVQVGDAVWFEAEDFMTTIFFQISVRWTKYKIKVQTLSRSFQKKLFRQSEQASLKFNSKLKIFISLFQIVSSMKTVLVINFPAGFASITSFISFFNLGSFALSCNVSFDFVDYLLFVTLGPVFIILILFLFHQRFAFEKLLLERSVDDHVKSEWQSKFYFYLLFFLFLILPSVSSTIFRMFSCENIDPDGTGDGSDFYLRADYTIACDSERYRFGMSWAIACVFLYPIGVPLFYYKVLHSHREHIVNRNVPYLLTDENGESIIDENFPDDFKVDEKKTKFREDALHSVRFLYWQYEPQFWYWEIIETFRKIILTGALVLVDQGSVLQVVVGFLLCLLFIKLYGFFSPYEDVDADISAESAQWQVLLFFFIALLIRYEAFSSNKLDAALLTVATCGVLVECVALIIRMNDEDDADAEEAAEELQAKNNAELERESDFFDAKKEVIQSDSSTKIVPVDFDILADEDLER